VLRFSHRRRHFDFHQTPGKAQTLMSATPFDAEHHRLAIDHKLLAPVLQRRFDNPWVTVGPVVAALGDQPHAIAAALKASSPGLSFLGGSVEDCTCMMRCPESFSSSSSKSSRRHGPPGRRTLHATHSEPVIFDFVKPLGADWNFCAGGVMQNSNDFSMRPT